MTGIQTRGAKQLSASV